MARSSSHAACDIAEDLDAPVIAVPTQSGSTARAGVAVPAAAADRRRQPRPARAPAAGAGLGGRADRDRRRGDDRGSVAAKVEAASATAAWPMPGDRVVLTGGTRLNLPGSTNHILVHTIGVAEFGPRVEGDGAWRPLASDAAATAAASRCAGSRRASVLLLMAALYVGPVEKYLHVQRPSCATSGHRWPRCSTRTTSCTAEWRRCRRSHGSSCWPGRCGWVFPNEHPLVVRDSRPTSATSAADARSRAGNGPQRLSWRTAHGGHNGLRARFRRQTACSPRKCVTPVVTRVASPATDGPASAAARPSRPMLWTTTT